MERIDAHTAARCFAVAGTMGLLAEEDTVTVFINQAVLAAKVEQLQHAFPPDTLHAIAIKANPLVEVLRTLNEMGTGAEAASMGEVVLAIAASFPDEAIVFDSPAKTFGELAWLKQHHPGIWVNVDSLDELPMYHRLGCPFRMGLRINPGVAVAAPEALQVSGEQSKFGVHLGQREAIMEAFRTTPALQGLHLHTGSQLHDPLATVPLVRTIIDLAKEINTVAGRQQVTTIDIGGGFPVNYLGDSLSVAPFAEALRKACPELWDGTYHTITEMGRFVHAHAGFVVAEVAAVKQQGGQHHAIIHAGADLFLRECYQPGQWPHRIHALDADGNLIAEPPAHHYHLGGPLCFSGDVVARNCPLPELRPGMKLLILDAGANTFALWSRHCSRPFPKVLMYDSREQDSNMRIIRQREGMEEVVRWWGG